PFSTQQKMSCFCWAVRVLPEGGGGMIPFWVKVRIWDACWMMFSLMVKLALPVPDTWHPGMAQLVLMMVDMEPDSVALLSMQMSSSSGVRSSSFSLLQANRRDRATAKPRYFIVLMIDTVD